MKVQERIYHYWSLGLVEASKLLLRGLVVVDILPLWRCCIRRVVEPLHHRLHLAHGLVRAAKGFVGYDGIVVVKEISRLQRVPKDDGQVCPLVSESLNPVRVREEGCASVQQGPHSLHILILIFIENNIKTTVESRT